MKKQLTLEQVLDIKAALDALDRTGVSMEMAGCISVEKLSMILSPIVKGYDRSQDIPGEKDKRKPELEAWKTALSALQMAHVQKDPSGNPFIIGGIPQYKDPTAFKAALDALKEKHPIAKEKDLKVEKANSPENLASLQDIEFEPIKVADLSGKLTWSGPVRILIRHGIIEG